ncbi:MAG TPA: GNAT family N-acetyltransferase [Xanthobacteraceae bacterium]|nr:GNAT family N-acetyltransferase [Xanthobacteraceae bacterium]
MPYTNRIFNSIGEVDLTAWEQVRAESGRSVFMDPRFIAAVEASMKPNCRFWYVILYDGNNRPAACACLTAMTIDLADLADPRLAWIIRHVPKLLSRFRNLKLFICGLPGSPGEKNLALRPINSSAEVLSVLDAVVLDLATETGSDAIVYKEFGKDDLEWTRPLLALGYRPISTPPMHFFKPSFRSFGEYCTALKTRYRQQINRSIRKLKHPGIRQAILTDREEILRLYTAEVHDLYCQMAAKAEAKLEILPIEFFHQLMSQLEGDVDLVVIFKDSRVIAFGWCLHAGSSYHLLFAGLDYQLNEQLDLYFNLMYAGLDRALRKQAATIHVGQSADAFKARIGCYSEPLYVLAKGLTPLMALLIRFAGNLLVVQKPALPSSDIFRKDVVENVT